MGRSVPQKSAGGHEIQAFRYVYHYGCVSVAGRRTGALGETTGYWPPQIFPLVKGVRGESSEKAKLADSMHESNLCSFVCSRMLKSSGRSGLHTKNGDALRKLHRPPLAEVARSLSKTEL